LAASTFEVDATFVIVEYINGMLRTPKFKPGPTRHLVMDAGIVMTRSVCPKLCIDEPLFEVKDRPLTSPPRGIVASVDEWRQVYRDIVNDVSNSWCVFVKPIFLDDALEEADRGLMTFGRVGTRLEQDEPVYVFELYELVA
jgi:hypothetical protein